MSTEQIGVKAALAALKPMIEQLAQSWDHLASALRKMAGVERKAHLSHMHSAYRRRRH